MSPWLIWSWVCWKYHSEKHRIPGGYYYCDFPFVIRCDVVKAVGENELVMATAVSSTFVSNSFPPYFWKANFHFLPTMLHSNYALSARLTLRALSWTASPCFLPFSMSSSIPFESHVPAWLSSSSGASGLRAYAGISCNSCHWARWDWENVAGD